METMSISSSDQHQIGTERRLRQLLISSAFTPEERQAVWNRVPSLSEERMHDAIRWASQRLKGHDRHKVPVVNRIASTAEKIAYRLDELERNPHKPIAPIVEVSND